MNLFIDWLENNLHLSCLVSIFTFNSIKEVICCDWHNMYHRSCVYCAGSRSKWVYFSFIFGERGEKGRVMRVHGAHVHVSGGKSLSGVPVNRLLFIAEWKTCPNWFSSKNHIIPFRLITCPLRWVQASLHFSPQRSLHLSMWSLCDREGTALKRILHPGINEKMFTKRSSQTVKCRANVRSRL